MNLVKIKMAIENGNQLVWNDPSPIEGNDYRIINISNMDEDICTIQYGKGSEAEVYLSEIVIRFILGYDFIDDANFENLTQYSTVKDADYNTEEWCTVDADTLEEAKEKYEEAFLEHKSEGRINGCM